MPSWPKEITEVRAGPVLASFSGAGSFLKLTSGAAQSFEGDSGAESYSTESNDLGDRLVHHDSEPPAYRIR